MFFRAIRVKTGKVDDVWRLLNSEEARVTIHPPKVVLEARGPRRPFNPRKHGKIQSVQGVTITVNGRGQWNVKVTAFVEGGDESSVIIPGVYFKRDSTWRIVEGERALKFGNIVSRRRYGSTLSGTWGDFQGGMWGLEGLGLGWSRFGVVVELTTTQTEPGFLDALTLTLEHTTHTSYQFVGENYPL